MKARFFSVALFLIVGVVVLVTTISNNNARELEYARSLASARENAERGIPFTAVQEYRAAFNIRNDSEEIYLEYVEQAKALDLAFYGEALAGYVKAFPASPNAYEMLCKYYFENENYRSLLEKAVQARDLGVATAAVKDMYFKCFYMLRYIKTGFDEAQSFLGNIALVKIGDKYGYIDNYGAYVIAPVYKSAAPFLGSATAVLENDEWTVVNKGGYVVAKPFGTVDSLSFVSNGLLRISKENKFDFVTTALDVPDTLEYDDASNFKNGIAAVKKGNKWGLIDNNKNMITDYVFSHIKFDEYGTCINNGIIFAKTQNGGKYAMYDITGTRIGTSEFDDVYPFVGAEPAAVCINGRWGFVDGAGNIVIEPQYEQAKSFSIGVAPIKKDDAWIYVDNTGKQVIEERFLDCLPFSENGVAAVYESGKWNYIKLLAYYYE